MGSLRKEASLWGHVVGLRFLLVGSVVVRARLDVFHSQFNISVSLRIDCEKLDR